MTRSLAGSFRLTQEVEPDLDGTGAREAVPLLDATEDALVNGERQPEVRAAVLLVEAEVETHPKLEVLKPDKRFQNIATAPNFAEARRRASTVSDRPDDDELDQLTINYP